jgi:hypothetical protein
MVSTDLTFETFPFKSFYRIKYQSCKVDIPSAILTSATSKASTLESTPFSSHMLRGTGVGSASNRAHARPLMCSCFSPVRRCRPRHVALIRFCSGDIGGFMLFSTVIHLIVANKEYKSFIERVSISCTRSSCRNIDRGSRSWARMQAWEREIHPRLFWVHTHPQ